MENELFENRTLADLSVVSLFSGIGGLDLGFSAYGVRSAAYLEIDGACCETLNRNRHLLGQHNEDVTPLDITQLAPADFFPAAVDLIIGGPPCQSFSAAGRRAGGVTGIDDARGSLFWYYCQYVKHFQPRAFVFENVRGILSSKGGKDWIVIQQSFAELGYRLHSRVLNAADYGVAQNRERLFLIGIREDLDISFHFPRPTHGPDSDRGVPYSTAALAFAGIDDPAERVPPYGGKYGDLIPAIPPGSNYSFYTEELGHPEPIFAWRSKFSGFLYKLSPDDVSKTIVAQQGKYDGPFHWKNRKCNLAELKRLQGFPDEFILPHGHTQAAKQIGNSVSPPLAKALANALLQQLGFDVPNPALLLSEDERLTVDQRKKSRVQKSRIKRSSAKLSVSEPDLFDSPDLSLAISLQERGRRVVRDVNYYEVHDISAGVGKIILISDKPSEGGMAFELQFFGQVSRLLSRITCEVNEVSFEAYSACWQSLHDLVSRATSFSSISPLYGHFTEPHPKFSLAAHVSGKTIDARFMSMISNFHFTSETHDMTVLKKIGIREPEKFLKIIRDFGIDARTNNTNRTIPVGKFRICYPFASPASERSFVAWTEPGDRKRNDFLMSSLSK